MKRLLLVLHLFFLLHVCFAQSGQKKPAIYRTHILSTQGYRMEGVLTSTGDSTLHLISVDQAKLVRNVNNFTPRSIHVRDIQELKIRRLGAVGTGAFFGGLLGFVTGAIIGFATYDPCNSAPFGFLPHGCDYNFLGETETAVLYSMGGLGIGAGIGMLIGGSQKNIYIHGDPVKYRQQKPKLDQFILKTQ